jgi:hypothetical protein
MPTQEVLEHKSYAPQVNCFGIGSRALKIGMALWQMNMLALAADDIHLLAAATQQQSF